MIKLIASDLDGTLLDDEKRLPAEIFDIIENLRSLGILFVPASGRQYANLKKLFRPAADKLPFICENGALIKYRDETVFSMFFPVDKAIEALKAIKTASWALPVLCCEDYAYVETDEEPFYSITKASYTHCKLVKNLLKTATAGKICKIAVYDKTRKANVNATELRNALPCLKTVVSGFEWCDVAPPEVNKGVAIKVLQEKLGIKKDECVAFGDHMNDYEMLIECGFPYVTGNGYPPLKETIKSTIGTNGEKGVIEFIRTKILHEK